MAISKNSRTGRQAIAETTDCLKKNNYGTGAGWCSKRDNKKANKGKGQTPGSTKSDTCKADWKKKHMAKASRSYKHREYPAWLKKTWQTGYNGMSYEQWEEVKNGTYQADL